MVAAQYTGFGLLPSNPYSCVTMSCLCFDVSRTETAIRKRPNDTPNCTPIVQRADNSPCLLKRWPARKPPGSPTHTASNYRIQLQPTNQNQAPTMVHQKQNKTNQAPTMVRQKQNKTNQTPTMVRQKQTSQPAIGKWSNSSMY